MRCYASTMGCPPSRDSGEAAMMHPVQIDNLADHPELVETVARWLWDEWGHVDPTGLLSSWTAGLRWRANRDTLPMTYVALEDGTPVGTVRLIENDMPSRRDLSPWLASLYVVPTARGRGVGAALVQFAVRQAAAMGTKRLYLQTSTARGLYERLGWQVMADAQFADYSVAIMSISTSIYV